MQEKLQVILVLCMDIIAYIEKMKLKYHILVRR